MKANQPDLLAAIAEAFDDRGTSPRERRLAEAERQKATTVSKGHGRLERRTLVSTTSLCDGYVDWPGLRQAFKLTRERTRSGQTTTTSEIVYGITSLSRERADAGKLLKLMRQHWGVEMLFWVRDVTFGEDACRVRSADGPAILSALRNTCFTLLSQAGHRNKAAALRRHAAHPHEALALITGYD